jgi:Uma2 family endonuclease
MTTVAAPTRWTYHDYLRLDDDQTYQIVEGNLIVSPAPSIVHQRVSSRLYTSLQSFVSERNLGEVFYAPVDVVFGEHDIVQPDLLFVRRENAGIVGEQAVVGTPDLIVEILSPGSLHLDRHRKRALYERAGVPEFWLVDPANRAIEVFRLGERGYELASFAAESGAVRSVVLDGFEVDLASVF